MAALPSSWQKPLQEAWRRMTDGEIWLLDGSSLPPEPPTFPAHVADCLVRGEELDAWQGPEGSYWWTAVAPSRSPVVRLAARSDRNGEWQGAVAGLANLLAAAHSEFEASEGLTDELIQAWDRLKIVYRISQIVSQRSELEEILQAVVAEMTELIEAREVFLYVEEVGETGKTLSATGAPLPWVPEVVGASLPIGRPARLSDLPTSARQLLSATEPVQDLLVVPLTTSRGAEGAIGWVSASRRFTASDVQLMSTVADQVAMLLEGARLREAREAARRMDHELVLAANIQSSMLPANLPRLPRAEVSAHLRPAARFGGDFYDVHEGASRTLILLGDVAGKGVGAAMLTALVHATFHSLAGTTSDPAQLLASMNRLMTPDLERAGAFVTCVLVSLDPASLELEYASAGHVEPAVWKVSTQSVEFFPATGLPLGIEAGAEYGKHWARLVPGEVLLLYSDGVSEAQDPRGKVLGVQGLADIMYAAHAAPSDRLIEAILGALQVFRAERPLGDDVALLAIRALPSGRENPVIPFVLPADLSAVRQVVDMTWQAGRATSHPSSEAHAYAFSLALTEVVANQVRHAYDGRGGRIQGCLIVGPDRWTADLYDSGRAFVPPAEPWSRPDPLDPPTRGYGLRLIYGLVDVVEYRRVGDVRNHWHLEKSLVGGSS